MTIYTKHRNDAQWSVGYMSYDMGKAYIAYARSIGLIAYGLGA